MDYYVRIFELTILITIFSSNRSSAFTPQKSMIQTSRLVRPLLSRNNFRYMTKVSMGTSNQKIVPTAAVSVVVKHRDESENLNSYVLVQRGKEPNKVRAIESYIFHCFLRIHT